MLLTPTKALAILAFTSTTLGYYNDYYEHEHSNYAPQRQQYGGAAQYGGYQKQLRQQQLQAREALEEEYLDDLFDFIARQAPATTSSATSTSASATSTASSSTTSGASAASATPSANNDAAKKKIEEDHKKKHELHEKIKKEKEHLHHAEHKIKHYTHEKHKHQEAIKKMEEHVKKIDEDIKKQKSAPGQLPKRWLDEFLGEWDI